MHPSPVGEKISASRFHLRSIVAIAGVCLVLALVARHYLVESANLPTAIAPPPRKGINAPFIKTPDAVVEKMVELAGLKKGDMVYDLGCGDGRIVITAAIKSDCSGVGYDIDPQRVAESKKNVELHEVGQRVHIIEQDIFTVDLSNTDVAMMYLLPWMMNKLLPQFQQMKPGSRIVTHDYWIDGVEPDEVFEMFDPENNKRTSIYVYKSPLRLNPGMEKGKPPQLGDLS